MWGGRVAWLKLLGCINSMKLPRKYIEKSQSQNIQNQQLKIQNSITRDALVGAAPHGIIITMTGVHRREIRRANQSIETVSGIAKK